MSSEQNARLEMAKRDLQQALAENRMAHALLIQGPTGCGKGALARWVAQAAVCTGEEPRPCGHCSGCVKALAGTHPDITIAGGGTTARSFHVDVVRAIRSDAYIKPNEAPRRVFILENAESMSDQAQNALLKVFEEPPDRVLFILTAFSATAMLPTVRSRAQLFQLEGGLAAAPEDMDLCAEICVAVPSSSEVRLLELTAPLIKDKERFRRILKLLLLLFRDAAVFRAGGGACLSGQRETGEALAHALTRDKLLHLLDCVQRAQRALEQNANASLLVTAFCAQLRMAAVSRRK